MLIRSDATHSPHGDDDSGITGMFGPVPIDATHSPHGNDDQTSARAYNRTEADAAHSPSGDDNYTRPGAFVNPYTMQLTPLWGQQNALPVLSDREGIFML